MTAKPNRFARPRSLMRVPGTSFDSSQGWLNQVALISPVSSATRAVRIFSRPRRRLDTARTTTSSAASSSPKSSLILFAGTGCSYRRGRCQSRSPTVSSPIRLRRRATVGPTPSRLSIGASRRSGRGTLRGRGQASGASPPAKATSGRVVGTRSLRSSVRRLAGSSSARPRCQVEALQPRAVSRPGTRRSRPRPGRRASRRRRRGSR